MKETAQVNAFRSESWSRSETILLRTLGAVLFACLTVVGAHIRIPLPFTPVPMTLQTFIVPLAGGFLGAAWGSAAMLLYLAFGLIGLDVFAAAEGGVAVFLAPTAGYIIGFIPAAATVGWLTRRYAGSGVLLFAVLLSQIIILICGVSGLMWNAGLGWETAVQKGAVPFLAGDLIKIAASFMILLASRQLITGRKSS